MPCQGRNSPTCQPPSAIINLVRNLSAYAALLAIVLSAVACRSLAPGAMDSSMASCIPPGTVVLAAADLDRLRAAPLYREVPPSVLAALAALNNASQLLVALNGKDLLFIAKGTFREAPLGAALLAPDLAVTGPADLVRAATEQHRTGKSGAPELLAQAEPLAASPIWAIASGRATLPLSGNAANLNRLLHFTNYTTLAIQLDARIAMDLKAAGRTPDSARQFEESLRAFLSLAAAADARQTDLAAVLNSIQVHRQDASVEASLSADSAVAAKWIERLAR